ncbi:hypothetical protein Msil_3411 [Methylocella silvestris BL2]|uniref:Uncharacterized protein n=1 Tax=Methylocella silvestris (strain DSM 15510 / CIP 108128 / LMG 27833 / NCIMB 13906 / BL2) TaxID=395965 RepID=B8ES94_METSB|nr:hypothetical protein [Methylocella silvestris]ACK52309.1 hypothetical protein Msil_3411 [Methylocella silvestris BL2]
MAKMFICAGATLLCAAVCAGIQPAAAFQAPHRHSAHWRRNIGGRAGLAPQPLRAPTVPDWTVQYGEIKGGASGSLGAMLEGRNPANGLP